MWAAAVLALGFLAVAAATQVHRFADGDIYRYDRVRIWSSEGGSPDAIQDPQDLSDFCLRVVDENGRPIRELTVTLDGPGQ